eukprot:2966758-Rhodomonas_salina.2
MPGTDMAYGARSSWRRPGTSPPIVLRTRYAMSGTDIRYAAVRDVRYCDRLWPYARCPVLRSAQYTHLLRAVRY